MTHKTLLLALSTLFLFACGGNTEKKTTTAGTPDGKSIYSAECSRCHGSNGKMGLAGAKDLSITTLTPDEMVPVITSGSNGGMMPAFGGNLTEEEIKAVANYIETNLKN